MENSSLIPDAVSFCTASPSRILLGNRRSCPRAKAENPAPGGCACPRCQYAQRKSPAKETEHWFSQADNVRLSGQARPDLVHQPIHAEQCMGIEVGALVPTALLNTPELANPVVTRETDIEDGHI